MANTFEFLHKGFVKAVFSDVPSLNVTAVDMGSEMISVTFDDKPVNRIATAVGTVASANVFVSVSATIQVLKASPADKIYTNRIKANGVIPGTATLYDDVNKDWTLQKMSIPISGFSANASEAHRAYTIEGIMPVNEDLIAELGGGVA